MNPDNPQLSLFNNKGSQTAPGADSWEVRFSRRAKRIAIHVLPHGGVEIVAPPTASAVEIQQFVELQSEWIRKARQRVLEQLDNQGPLLPELISLQLLNRRFQVVYDVAAKPGYSLHADRLEIVSPDITPTDCWPVLKRWLRETARKQLPPMLRSMGDRVGVQPNKVQVRNQKTRWGSCSSSGTISLNAAILMLPPSHANYVMIHELCHLTHMNHSSRYWSLVASHVPDYKALDNAVDAFWGNGPAWLR